MVFYCILFFGLNFFYDYFIKDPLLKKLYYFTYTLLEYVSFACIFWLGIKNASFKRFILFLSLLFVVFQIIYYSAFTLRRLDTVPIAIESFLIFIFIIYYLYEQFRSTKTATLYSNYLFWISIGIMFYLAGAFFFNLLANHLDRKVVTEYWYLSYNADIVKNILFSVGILIFAKNSAQSNQRNTTIPYLDMI